MSVPKSRELFDRIRRGIFLVFIVRSLARAQRILPNKKLQQLSHIVDFIDSTQHF
jgi:hypothetical protein